MIANIDGFSKIDKIRVQLLLFVRAMKIFLNNYDKQLSIFEIFRKWMVFIQFVNIFDVTRLSFCSSIYIVEEIIRLYNTENICAIFLQ